MIFHNGGLFMPGRHVTDQQMRLFMTLKQTHTVPVAAAKAGISQATGYRIQSDPTMPSQKKKPRGRRRPDPLADIFDAEVVPMLQSGPVTLSCRSGCSLKRPFVRRPRGFSSPMPSAFDADCRSR